MHSFTAYDSILNKRGGDSCLCYIKIKISNSVQFYGYASQTSQFKTKLHYIDGVFFAAITSKSFYRPQSLQFDSSLCWLSPSAVKLWYELDYWLDHYITVFDLLALTCLHCLTWPINLTIISPSIEKSLDFSWVIRLFYTCPVHLIYLQYSHLM